MQQPITQYISEINKLRCAGNATEHRNNFHSISETITFDLLVLQKQKNGNKNQGNNNK
jgi:hypothetical protein